MALKRHQEKDENIFGEAFLATTTYRYFLQAIRMNSMYYRTTNPLFHPCLYVRGSHGPETIVK